MNELVLAAINQVRNSGRSPQAIRVRWLLNPDRERVENVELAFSAGRIETIRQVRTSTGVIPIAVMPRFINAHTHLEFSKLRSPLDPPQPFPEWIRAVIDYRRKHENERSAAIEQGARESLNAGTACVGEIDSTGLSPGLIQETGLESICFREFIGLQPDRIDELATSARRYLSSDGLPGRQPQAYDGLPVRRALRGISPHAPYTVHPALLSRLVNVSQEFNCPMAMHVAETTDEIELLHLGRGRLAGFLKSLDLFDPQVFRPGRSVREQLEELARSPRALVIHGNYLTNGDIEFLARHPQLTVVYCPRTHAWFRHAEHPLRRLRAAGVRVVLGTDSRASNPDLDIAGELKHVAQNFTEIPIGERLAMVTTASAEAIGLDASGFRVEVGAKVDDLQFVDAHETCGF